MSTLLAMSGAAAVAAPGSAVFAPGEHYWTVPAGVYRICVVLIAAGAPASGNNGGKGGNLRYQNDIPVTPGSVLLVRVDPWNTGGQKKASIDRVGGGLSISTSHPVGYPLLGYDGGSGGGAYSVGQEVFPGGGGGAGGYLGWGGNGMSPQTSPGGDGGVGGTNGGKGGGVSLYGAGSYTAPLCGGGGGISSSPDDGGVRVIWGADRAFPSTNVSTSTN